MSVETPAEAEARAAAARAAAARAAVDRLASGMTIGLGSGRAVAAVIELAAERWPVGPPLLCTVASSETERQARAAGFAVVSLDDLDFERRGPAIDRRAGPPAGRRASPPEGQRAWAVARPGR